ncbi:MAG TPA: hypothetical protein VLG10_10525 [Methylomirabilota bacterium]|nr:hypothetical protein [Methylomirabilota bacterium]
MGARREPKMSTVLVAMALAIGGCAYVWQRPGTPPEVMEQDRRECDDLAQQISMQADIQALADRDWPGSRIGWSYGGGYPEGGSLMFKQRTAQQCMEARGYRLVKQPARMSRP